MAKLNNELNILLAQLDKALVPTSEFRRQLELAGNNQEEIVRLTREMQKALSNVENTAGNLYDRLQAITSEMKNGNVATNMAVGAYTKLTQLASELSNDEAGITDLSKQQAERVLEKAKIQQKALDDLGRTREIQELLLSNDEDLSEKQLAVKKAYEDQNREAQRVVELAEARLDQEKRISRQMGVTGAVVGGTGALMERLGMRSGIFKDAVEDAQNSMRAAAKQADILGQKASKISIAFIGISKLAKGFGQALFDPATIGLKILDTLFKINGQSVEISRLTGQSASNFDTFANGAASAIDQMEVVAELTKQIGVNAQNVFSKENLQGAANLKVEMGLAAEQAGTLALMAQTGGTSVESLTDNIVATTSAFNGANRSAVSQGQILRDIGDASDGIRASFAGGTEELIKGAAAARRLGMSIKDLDNIAHSLLDFESSIESELEAQLLIGRNINLAKARELALSNDLEGLGEELLKNSSDIYQFGKMNRIQQEAQAKALGMTRDQLARVAYERALELKMSHEQAAAAANVNAEDMKRITAQENFTKALEKIAAALAPILDFVGNILSIPWVPQILLGAVAVGKLGSKFKSMFTTAFDGFKRMKEGIKSAGGLMETVFGKFYKGGQFMPGGGRAKAGGERAGGLLGDMFGKKGPKEIPKEVGDSTGKGITGVTESISKIDMKKVLQGAAAMALVAASLYIFGKAVQQFSEVSWGDVGKAIVGLFALVGAVAALGAIITSPVGAVAILAGAAAMLIMGGAVMVLGLGVKMLAEGFNSMIPNLMGLTKMIPELFQVADALDSIGNGLIKIAAAGILAIPALMVVSTLSESQSTESDGFSRLEAKMDKLIAAVQAGGNVYLDGNRVGEATVLGTYKLE